MYFGRSHAEGIGRRSYEGYRPVAPGAATAAAFLGPGTDSAVVQQILASRDVFTWTEFASGMASTVLDTTKRITVPVMLVNGSMDRLCEPRACGSTGSLRAVETLYFSPSARLRVYVLPRSGHAVDLAPGTVEYQRRVIDWADGM